MRVLYVEFVRGFGGSLTTLLDTVEALGPEIEPILLIPYDPTPYRSLPSNLELRVVTLPDDTFDGSGSGSALIRNFYWAKRWVPLLDEVIQRDRPAIIHANNAAAINLPAGIAGRRRGIPVISHQRDTEYPGWPNWLVLKSNVFSHHIAGSQAMVRSLTRLGMPSERCSMIYDPICEPPRTTPPPNGSGRPLVVAMHSMLMQWKGQEVFLRAISHLKKRVDQPFRAIIGGSEPFGEMGYLAHLKQMAAELGLENTVEFSGFTPNIWDRLLETNVLVLASVEPEPGGHIVQEAMMCGVPVVVTDDGGPSEYARDSEGGLVVPRGDANALADAIERLLIDPDLRLSTARRGQGYARRAFDPGVIADRISTIYQACLNGARPRPAGLGRLEDARV